jgi:hypothetical protein
MARSRIKGTNGKPRKKAAPSKSKKIASQHVTSTDHYSYIDGSGRRRTNKMGKVTVEKYNDGRPTYTHTHTDSKGKKTKTTIKDDEKSRYPVKGGAKSWSKRPKSGASSKRTYKGTSTGYEKNRSERKNDPVRDALKITDQKKRKSRNVKTKVYPSKKQPKSKFIN